LPEIDVMRPFSNDSVPWIQPSGVSMFPLSMKVFRWVATRREASCQGRAWVIRCVAGRSSWLGTPAHWRSSATKS
jgi:hypothetical protein